MEDPLVFSIALEAKDVTVREDMEEKLTLTGASR